MSTAREAVGLAIAAGFVVWFWIRLPALMEEARRVQPSWYPKGDVLRWVVRAMRLVTVLIVALVLGTCAE